MLKAIYLHELRNALCGAAFYIYFAILAGLGFLFVAMSSGVVKGGVVDLGGGGKVMLNSDFGIAALLAIITMFGLVIVAAIAGQATYQDIQYDTTALLFTKPISKFDYLGGRFGAALTQLLLLFAGPVLGFWLGTVTPWWPDRSHIGPNNVLNYLQPYVLIVVPNIILAASALFALVLWTRRMLVAYVASVIAFIGYQVASNYTSNVDLRMVSALFDPFGLNALSYMTQYWTPFERNTLLLPFSGIMFWNRVLWIAIGAGLLAVACWRFSTAARAAHAGKNVKAERDPAQVRFAGTLALPHAGRDFSWRVALAQLLSGTWLQFAETVRSIFFAVVALAGFGMTLIILLNVSSGVAVYPLTYIVLEWGRQAFSIFALAIITFYAGELVWRDREAKIDQLIDTQPVSTWVLFGQKLGALLLVQVLLVLLLFLACIVAQVIQGYHHFEFGQYAHELLLNRLAGFWILCALAICIQVLVDQRYLAYGAMVLYFIALTVLPQLGFGDHLYLYGQTPPYQYSDMDAYGVFAASLTWLHLYWGLGALMLAVLSGLLWVRGAGSSPRARLKLFKDRFSTAPRLALAALALAFAVIGSFVYYNTHVLNDYVTSRRQNELQAEYEKLYARYRTLPEPRIVNVDARVELYPRMRQALIAATMQLRNETAHPLSEVALTLPVWSGGAHPFGLQHVAFGGGQTALIQDAGHHFYLYRLARPLDPGHSVQMHVAFDYEHHGFVNDQPDTQFVENGTVLTQDYLPYIGYDRNVELADDSMRHRYGLRGVWRLPPPQDQAARRDNLIAADADWVNFHVQIGTDGDQTAIFPGELRRSWMQGGRRYFDYRSEAPMLNIYSIVSGRYAIMRGRWRNVDLAIYYNPGHTYNLATMMTAMKRSLAYCTTEYGPYQFHELRIVEFPRYASYAESLPATIPYSEAIGFITRYNSSDSDAYDEAFYVTAHETAHQWWGHQVVTARTEGAGIIESLAQYTALMVMKHSYGERSMRKFLRNELSHYLDGRGLEPNQEYPLYRVEHQPYIYYDKGGQVMYTLAQYVGEHKIDAALAAFDRAYKFHGAPYPTTLDMLRYLRAATPPRYAYLISDDFTHITLYDARPVRAAYVEMPDGRYRVTLTVDVAKYRADGKGEERRVGLDDWLYLGVRSGAGQYLYLQRRQITAPEMTFSVTVDGKPAMAGIDPLDMLINRDFDVDMMRVSRNSHSPA